MTKTYHPTIPSQLADELTQAFATAEPQKVCNVIGQALRDFNVSEIAKKTGLQRSSVYRAFGSDQLPNFSTVLAVLTAMDLRIKVEPMAGAHKRWNEQVRKSTRRSIAGDIPEHD